MQRRFFMVHRQKAFHAFGKLVERYGKMLERSREVRRKCEFVSAIGSALAYHQVPTHDETDLKVVNRSEYLFNIGTRIVREALANRRTHERLFRRCAIRFRGAVYRTLCRHSLWIAVQTS